MLIPNWRDAWKFHTVLLAALLGALNWVVDHPDFLTPDLVAALALVFPPEVMSAINRWTPLLLIAARVIKQNTAAPAATAPAAPASKESP